MLQRIISAEELRNSADVNSELTPSIIICSHVEIVCVMTVIIYAGRSGLAVTCLTAVWEDQGSNLTVGSRRFLVNTATIYSLGHGMHTLTAVPRLTQPSTLRGMVKSVSAFRLSNNNNKCWWWVWLLAACRQPMGSLQANSQPRRVCCQRIRASAVV